MFREWLLAFLANLRATILPLHMDMVWIVMVKAWSSLEGVDLRLRVVSIFSKQSTCFYGVLTYMATRFNIVKKRKDLLGKYTGI